MGQGQSKDELLYQQVSYGNTEGIKSLHRDGAGLEVLEPWQNFRGNVNFVIIIDCSRFGSVACFYLFFIEIGVLIFDAVEGQRCEDPLDCCLYESSSL